MSYDVIFVTSLPLRQPNDVTKITSQNLSIFEPLPQSKFMATPALVSYEDCVVFVVIP